MIKDRHINHKLATQFIPAFAMRGLLEDGTSKLLTGLGAGAPVFAEMLATSNLAALQLDQAGDEVNGVWLFPWDKDNLQSFLVRILFWSKTTDTDLPIWKFHWKELSVLLAALSNMPTAAGGGRETLTTQKYTPGNAWSLVRTDWMRATWSDVQDRGSKVGIMYSVELDSMGGASSAEIFLEGIEFAYAREMTTHRRMDVATYPLAAD